MSTYSKLSSKILCIVPLAPFIQAFWRSQYFRLLCALQFSVLLRPIRMLVLPLVFFYLLVGSFALRKDKLVFNGLLNQARTLIAHLVSICTPLSPYSRLGIPNLEFPWYSLMSVSLHGPLLLRDRTRPWLDCKTTCIDMVTGGRCDCR